MTTTDLPPSDRVDHEPGTLVGYWFHSWEDLKEGEDPKDRRMVNGRAVVWQGQITNRVGDDYLIQLYSWWDGEPNGGQRLVAAAEIRDWTFYVSDEQLRMGLGCSERWDTGYQCQREITHRTSLGNYVCHKHAEHYSEAVEIDSAVGCEEDGPRVWS